MAGVYAAALRLQECPELENVQEFFKKYYAPNNAVLTISGNIDHTKVYELAEKWFGNIPANQNGRNQFPSEPLQTSSRFLEIEANGDV